MLTRACLPPRHSPPIDIDRESKVDKGGGGRKLSTRWNTGGRIVLARWSDSNMVFTLATDKCVLFAMPELEHNWPGGFAEKQWPERRHARGIHERWIPLSSSFLSALHSAGFGDACGTHTVWPSQILAQTHCVDHRLPQRRTRGEPIEGRAWGVWAPRQPARLWLMQADGHGKSRPRRLLPC